MIPYKIHHIWLQGGIPEEYRDNYEKWDKALPDWEHRVWDEESLLGLCTEEQMEKYGKLESLINKINFLKYILIYTEGGIYADLDSYPVQDLYKFFVQDEIKDINLSSSVMDQRYPYNTERPNKPFGNYNVILPGRNTLSYYPDGKKCVLLDNPVLMSTKGDYFWADMLNWMEARTNSKDLPHEPYGPYGMSDYLFLNYENPYLDNILVLPHNYLMGMEEPNENTYIVHEAKQGW